MVVKNITYALLSMLQGVDGRHISALLAAILLAGLTLAACGGGVPAPATGDPAVGAPILSENGHFLAGYRAEQPPITLNTTHTWVLTVTTPASTPVDSAIVTVDGGMPGHNHGLPTQPQVTKTEASGIYRVEGVRFQMPGAWFMTFTIQADGVTDKVTFPFTLP